MFRPTARAPQFQEALEEWGFSPSARVEHTNALGVTCMPKSRVTAAIKMKTKAHMNERVAGQTGWSGRERFNPASGTAFAARPNPSPENRGVVRTKDVIDHHLKTFGDGDLEGILSDYAPGAVMFTANGPLRGVDEIRPLFQAMMAEFGKSGAGIHLKERCIYGDHAYLLWNAETADNVYELGTDTFVVRNGKIVAQSFTGKITPKG